jgi:hypothetical protein
MNVKLTWTPGSGATSQTVQLRRVGTSEWFTYTTIYDGTTNFLTVVIPDGSYQFRVTNSCQTCGCPEGYTSVGNGVCSASGTVPAIQNTKLTQVTRTPYLAYGISGTRVYNEQLPNVVFDPSKPYTLLDTSNPFWIRTSGLNNNNFANDLNNGPVNRIVVWGRITDNVGQVINNYSFSSYLPVQQTNAQSTGTIVTVSSTAGIHINMTVTTIDNVGTGELPFGTFVTEIISNNQFRISKLPTVPLNGVTLFINYVHIPPLREWIGFETCLTLTETKTFYIALAGDNEFRLRVNNVTKATSFDIGDESSFYFLHIFPIQLNAGLNVITMLGKNNEQFAGFGCEIFDLSNRPSGTSVVQFLNAQTSYDNINVLFTSRQALTFTSNTWICPTGTEKDVQTSCNVVTCTGQASINCITGDSPSNYTSVQRTCNSPVISSVVLEPSLGNSTPSTQQLINCLDGVTLEFIYLGHINDLALLPAGYTLSSQDTSKLFNAQGQGLHICNRAFFEVFMGTVYVGDALINNGSGVPSGAITRSFRNTCQDYNNRPGELRPGNNNVWDGTPSSRYSKVVINAQQAQAIAASNNSNKIALRLVSALTTYNTKCNDTFLPHLEVTWFRVTRPNPSMPNGVEILYNGCPESYATTIEICSNF